MITFSESVLIDKPVEEVFAFTANLNNLPKWQKSVLSVDTTAAGISKGSQYSLVRKFMGREVKATMEVTDYTPNSLLALKGMDGTVNLKLKNTFEPEGKSTKLTINMEAEVGGFFKVAESVVAKQMKEQMKGDELVLKGLLENS